MQIYGFLYPKFIFCLALGITGFPVVFIIFFFFYQWLFQFKFERRTSCIQKALSKREERDRACVFMPLNPPVACQVSSTGPFAPSDRPTKLYKLKERGGCRTHAICSRTQSHFYLSFQVMVFFFFPLFGIQSLISFHIFF